MIKFISAAEVLNIRSTVLRDGKVAPSECILPTDTLPGAFHIGFFESDLLVSIASIHPENHPKFGNNGYKLRGMATIENYRGKGYGNKLLNFAITYLRKQEAHYLWCNARTVAVNFYTSLGFEIISEEFEIKPIGLHYEMYVKVM